MYFDLTGIFSGKLGNTFYKGEKGENAMKKSSHENKKKVPKITEAEYEAYISALRSQSTEEKKTETS